MAKYTVRGNLTTKLNERHFGYKKTDVQSIWEKKVGAQQPNTNHINGVYLKFKFNH